MPGIVLVKKCKVCLATAAHILKEKASSLLQKSYPDARADFDSDPFPDEACFPDYHDRGRRHPESLDDFDHSSWSSRDLHSSIESRRRNLSNCRSEQSSFSTPFEDSSDSHLYFPTPDPNIILPIQQPPLFRFYTFPSKKASRSSLIQASCIPQVDWTRADCRHWIAACFREVFGLSPPCALRKAGEQKEAGDALYHTPLWTWVERWPYSGQRIYYHLQACRNEGLVRDLEVEKLGHREFSPEDSRSRHSDDSRE